MDFDDFDIQIQSDEIIPEEYYDWLNFCLNGDKQDD
jgi:hypothetical protein